MRKFFAIIFVVLLAGCTKEIDYEAMEKESAEEIFAKGKAEMSAKNYEDAAKVFEELGKLHPYSRLTADAELLAGDCYYKKGKFDEAVSSYEIFVKTHPTHDSVPYALYMLGVINYDQMAIIGRDQDAVITALSYFEELCTRYPETKYVKDAKERMRVLRDQQAGKEMYVARYYQKRLNYTGAIGRLNAVIDGYADTIHAPEAMLRLVECYTAMGADRNARAVNRVLQQNHKGTTWAMHAQKIVDSYQQKK